MSCTRLWIILIVILLSLSHNSLFSQVNTETLRRDFSKEGIFHQINFDLGFASGNTEYTILRTNYRVDYISGDYHYFGIASYSYSAEKVETKENRGFIHLRCIYDLHTIIALEGFAQKEFNEFILLKDRNLLGGGSRLRLANLSNVFDTNITVYSYLGLGAMLEHESLKDHSPSSSLIMRMTSYFTLGIEFPPNLNFKIVNYYQPHFDNFDNYRFLSEGSLSIKVSKYVSLLTTLRFRYDSDPPEKVKPRDLNLLNGIQIDF